MARPRAVRDISGILNTFILNTRPVLVKHSRSSCVEATNR